MIKNYCDFAKIDNKKFTFKHLRDNYGNKKIDVVTQPFNNKEIDLDKLNQVKKSMPIKDYVD